MAAITINWNEVAKNVEEKAATSGNVDRYENDLKAIVADGQEYTVSKLVAILNAGYNQGRDEAQEEIKVNWSTVKYTLTHKGGFRPVEGKDNTFVADADLS